MSIVRSVSDITNILSSIIQKPILQNVSVHGEVSVDGADPSGVFWLRQGGNKIRCFVPDGKIALFAALLTAGNTVVVNGKITLFYQFSQYQIKVSNIQGAGAPGAKVNVTKITNQISDLVAKTQELQDIRIQGKVLEVFSAAVSKASNWDLCDVGGPPGLQIKCVHRGPGPIGVLVQKGNNVCAQGNVSIYPSQSLYQIDVTGVDPITENSTEQCQCSGCDRCGSPPQCNRSREVANFESPDELYELCPECYAISPDHETKVAKAIYDYFDELQVNGFSPYIHTKNAGSECKECQIQFGARNGIADVVLADGNGSFAVIAECKGAGYVGHGVEQLKSYLCATDTRFGVFANRTDPEQWEFYENRRRNRFDQIDRSEFEAGVVKRIATRERLKDEIKALKKAKDDLVNRESELETEIAQLRQTERDLRDTHKQLISEIGKKHVQQSEFETEIGKLAKTKHDLQDTYKQLRKEIETTTQQHADLKQEITELKNQKLELETTIGHLEEKECLLHTSHEQRKEKIQQFETLFNDLKSDLLDSEPPSRSDNNVDLQRTGTEKKLGIVSKLKNLFSKEKQ